MRLLALVGAVALLAGCRLDLNVAVDLAILTVRCVGNPACHGKTYHVKDTSLPWPPPGAAAR